MINMSALMVMRSSNSVATIPIQTEDQLEMGVRSIVL
jgi:hypothetical protein